VIRVLAVDDDFMVAKAHSGYGERTEGFQVVGAAHTGTDALRAVRDLRPGLVLAEVDPPGTDGIAVLRELRADPATADTDVVAVTAAREVGTIRAAMRGGAPHYPLTRPCRTGYGTWVRRSRKLRMLSERPAAGRRDVDDVFGGRPRSVWAACRRG
jgi:response regulator of citrate/malate metabolism